ncbi:acriflavin resistance protein [Brachyspira hampsonii 30599]|nr:acriflavin resistance protein [Brachyspira hampsonii 30599]
MKNFIELVVKRPVAVFMCMIAVLILGFVSLSKLAVDFFTGYGASIYYSKNSI